MTATDQPAGPDFFTDTPLRHEMDDWLVKWRVRMAILERWAGYKLVAMNGHCVWKLPQDIGPDDLRVFYDGDYSDVLAPDDPRILIPRKDCTDLSQPLPRLEWGE